MWQIEKTTKRCKDCTTSIEVNRDYFSALFYALPSGTETKDTSRAKETPLVRYDFCPNCWEKRVASGEDLPFSFWQTKIEPPAEPPKTPKEILLSFFDNLFTSQQEAEKPSADAKPSFPARPAGGVESDTKLKQPTGSEGLQEDRLKRQVKYLFALILLRKKLLRLRESFTKQEVKYLVLERVSDNKSYEVPEVTISDNEFIALRDEFSRHFEFRI